MAFNLTEEENRLGNECWEKDKQIAQLKADLAKERSDRDMAVANFYKFGGHTAECPKRKYRPDPPYDFKCECGFAEAKERWE